MQSLHQVLKNLAASRRPDPGGPSERAGWWRSTRCVLGAAVSELDHRNMRGKWTEAGGLWSSKFLDQLCEPFISGCHDSENGIFKMLHIDGGGKGWQGMTQLNTRPVTLAGAWSSSTLRREGTQLVVKGAGRHSALSRILVTL